MEDNSNNSTSKKKKAESVSEESTTATASANTLGLDEDYLCSVDRAHVEHAKKNLASALNLIEGFMSEMKYSCERRDWNDDVLYQIEEATIKLGYALATFTNWYDGMDEENK